MSITVGASVAVYGGQLLLGIAALLKPHAFVLYLDCFVLLYYAVSSPLSLISWQQPNEQLRDLVHNEPLHAASAYHLLAQQYHGELGDACFQQQHPEVFRALQALAVAQDAAADRAAQCELVDALAQLASEQFVRGVPDRDVLRPLLAEALDAQQRVQQPTLTERLYAASAHLFQSVADAVYGADAAEAHASVPSVGVLKMARDEDLDTEVDNEVDNEVNNAMDKVMDKVKPMVTDMDMDKDRDVFIPEPIEVIALAPELPLDAEAPMPDLPFEFANLALISDPSDQSAVDSTAPVAALVLAKPVLAVNAAAEDATTLPSVTAPATAPARTVGALVADAVASGASPFVVTALLAAPLTIDEASAVACLQTPALMHDSTVRFLLALRHVGTQPPPSLATWLEAPEHGHPALRNLSRIATYAGTTSTQQRNMAAAVLAAAQTSALHRHLRDIPCLEALQPGFAAVVPAHDLLAALHAHLPTPWLVRGAHVHLNALLSSARIPHASFAVHPAEEDALANGLADRFPLRAYDRGHELFVAQCWRTGPLAVAGPPVFHVREHLVLRFRWGAPGPTVLVLRAVLLADAAVLVFDAQRAIYTLCTDSVAHVLPRALAHDLIRQHAHSLLYEAVRVSSQ